MLREAQGEGRSVVGREKVWNLTFADDLVIGAKSEREIKEMINSLEKYVRKKKREVNVEKTKMTAFKKENERGRQNEKWNRDGRTLCYTCEAFLLADGDDKWKPKRKFHNVLKARPPPTILLHLQDFAFLFSSSIGPPIFTAIDSKTSVSSRGC
ncbi:hypothetical protein MTP99_013312 [Tenebrio molitor]|nr:hypothetical protein MTP99_013312 [Tenebrio molitor]